MTSSICQSGNLTILAFVCDDARGPYRTNHVPLITRNQQDLLHLEIPVNTIYKAVLNAQWYLKSTVSRGRLLWI